jgi:hypothetical protein
LFLFEIEQVEEEEVSAYFVEADILLVLGHCTLNDCLLLVLSVKREHVCDEEGSLDLTICWQSELFPSVHLNTRLPFLDHSSVKGYELGLTHLNDLVQRRLFIVCCRPDEHSKISKEKCTELVPWIYNC